MGIKPREALNKIDNYVAARSIESVKSEFGVEKVIKLAGNENTLGCSNAIIEKIVENFSGLSYYPDLNCTLLREKLAQKHGVREEELIFGNGSFELISLVAQTFLEQGEEVINIEPSFGWYKNVTYQMGGNIINVPLKNFKTDLNEVFEKITESTKIIWLCNPNNPVGTIVTHGELEDFLKKLPDRILLVLDEAYVDFINEEDFPRSLELLKTYKNIIILRTFSKAYGLASFRLGYGISTEEIIGNMNKVRLPINVNAAAQIAALASLEDTEFKNRVIENNKKGIALYYKELESLGLTYVKTNCNFILFDTGLDSAWVAQEYLKRGIIIRPAFEFGYPTWVRVTIGTREENTEVLKVLKEIIKMEEKR